MIPLLQKKDGGKGLAALIIARKLKKEPEAPSEESHDLMDGDMGLDSAVEELFDGLKERDVTKVKEALKSFVQMCMDECPEDEKEEDESEESEKKPFGL